MRCCLRALAPTVFALCCTLLMLVCQDARSAAPPASAASPEATQPAAAATVHTGPLYSRANLPWPAPVAKHPPQYPPALTPQAELKTFRMPPGYRVELVASEPLIQDPILMEFDADGRLWVIEYTGWAAGENMENSLEPVNDLVVLEDTDHDGVYDKRTVFMDHLVLPRAFKILDHNCALVGEPPQLWKACDTDGDGKSDTKELISNTFSTKGVVEHGANGLFWGMDNTIYVAEHTWDVQFSAGKFTTVPTENRGQWGITQDDAGRIYRNVNTDPIFVDYVAPKYYMRNSDLTRTRGLYESLVRQEDTQVWPIRPTLGVNRGYRPEVSRPDGSAYYYQGVSSPLIYRGDQLPKELYGNAVVVDGPTNLVHLLKLTDDGTGRLAASDFYRKGEFLASSDERFRPVALAPGWDGSFYIVDMYRGVSQDGPIQTNYLRSYIMDHKLWQGTHYGRIYRVVHDGMKSDPRPAMFEETPAQLVAHLADANGWYRDTAQQLLVQRNDSSVVPALQQLAHSSGDFRARLQALWTLDGMNALDVAVVDAALHDPAAEIRAAALRWSEHWLGSADGPLTSAVLQRQDDPSWLVRRQLAATLGELPKEQRLTPVLQVLQKYGEDGMTVDAALSGLKGLESDALAQAVVQQRASTDVVEMLAGAVAKSRDSAGVQRVLALAGDAAQSDAIRLALLHGAAAGLTGAGFRATQEVAGGRAGAGIGGAPGGRRGPAASGIDVPAEPTVLVGLATGAGDMASAAKAVLVHVSWPGKPVPPPAAARTPEEDKLYERGRLIYSQICAACHQPDGQGAPHVGAALAGSKFVNANPEIATRILTNGKDGSIGAMPPVGTTLSDDDLAGVLTYIRQSFGNTASVVHPAEAVEYREMNRYHKKPWSDQELSSALQRQRGPAANQ